MKVVCDAVVQTSPLAMPSFLYPGLVLPHFLLVVRSLIQVTKMVERYAASRAGCDMCCGVDHIIILQMTNIQSTFLMLSLGETSLHPKCTKLWSSHVTRR